MLDSDNVVKAGFSINFHQMALFVFHTDQQCSFCALCLVKINKFDVQILACSFVYFQLKKSHTCSKYISNHQLCTATNHSRFYKTLHFFIFNKKINTRCLNFQMKLIQTYVTKASFVFSNTYIVDLKSNSLKFKNFHTETIKETIPVQWVHTKHTKWNLRQNDTSQFQDEVIVAMPTAVSLATTQSAPCLTRGTSTHTMGLIY